MPQKMDGLRATITFDVPQRVEYEEIASFICEALEAWGGGQHPDAPLFESLSVKSVFIGNRTFLNPEPKEWK